MIPEYAQSQEPDLAAEVADLRARLAEAEDTLEAIRSGEVDALLVSGAQGEQVFTLQGAETPYRFLVEAMNEGAMQVIPDGTIVYANARFAGFVGMPLQQVVTSSWRKYFPVSDHPRFEALLAANKLSGGRGEFNLQAADGVLRPVLLSFAPMSAAEVQGVSVIVTDLAEMKETALALKQTVADLEAFSYSISHDMRTPLRAMQGFSSMLLQSCADRLTQEELDYLRRIVASSSRLDQLIRDVLRYSRTARAELVLSKVDVTRLTRQIIESYPTLVEPRAEIVLAGDIPAVMGHEASLSQCISNLLDNGVKFMAPDRLPRIIVSAKTENGQVRVLFADNGIGIEPRHQQRIFKIFERVHPVDKYGGTGIGLSIVKKTIERMGGQVGVESELGKGSTFWIQLPAAKD